MSDSRRHRIEDEFDVIKVDSWVPPKEDDDPVKYISMPNIARPLHGLAPREIWGPSTWSHVRKKCYAEHNYTCEICGYVPDRENKEWCHAHEVYSTNYKTKTAVFYRAICLCPRCHLLCIHTGRALTLYKRHDVYMTAETLLGGAEHAFKLVHDYNERRPEGEPELRLFHVFLDYLLEPELEEPMRALIKKYDIKFYKAAYSETKEWSKWKLMVGNRFYPTPYKNIEEWEQAMEQKNTQDNRVETSEDIKCKELIKEILGEGDKKES